MTYNLLHRIHTSQSLEAVAVPPLALTGWISVATGGRAGDARPFVYPGG
jgi:hypothetical protein